MRGDWMDEARRFEHVDKAILRELEEGSMEQAYDPARPSGPAQDAGGSLPHALNDVLLDIETYLSERSDADYSDKAGSAVGNQEYYLLEALKKARGSK